MGPICVTEHWALGKPFRGFRRVVVVMVESLTVLAWIAQKAKMRLRLLQDVGGRDYGW